MTMTITMMIVFFANQNRRTNNMAVYVDKLTPCIPNKNWRYNQSCHLVADTPDELHLFAKAIGLKRAWAQTGNRVIHYDLNKSKRVKAVKLGAIELNNPVEFVAFMRKYRKEHPLRCPACKGRGSIGMECRCCKGAGVI
jgi:hypothetical protein